MKIIIASLIITIGILVSSPAYAVAYCSLRDPTDALHHFYPELKTYKALDGIVDDSTRLYLAEHLPNLHFDEFGTHTLYAVYDSERAIGFVHSRTEKGDYGLDELIWSLTPELHIKDFRYQRSRSKYSNILEGPEFILWIGGKSHLDLSKLLTSDGLRLQNRPKFIPDKAEKLAVTVIRSAIKTILVTESVWGDQLSQY